jgi:hypothetical protein
MAEKIQINLSNDQKKSSDEQFLQAPPNWEKCSASSTLGYVLSINVASEMTNSNLFQKIQKIPKNPKLAKKTKIGQKSQFLANFGILANLALLSFFLKFLAFLANFGFFG